MSIIYAEKWPSRLRVSIPRAEGAEVSGRSLGIHEGHGRLHGARDGAGPASQDQEGKIIENIKSVNHVCYYF